MQINVELWKTYLNELDIQSSILENKKTLLNYTIVKSITFSIHKILNILLPFTNAWMKMTDHDKIYFGMVFINISKKTATLINYYTQFGIIELRFVKCC